MEFCVKNFSWGSFSPFFVDELVDWIAGRSVLEVFAGNGLLAKLLSDRGVKIKATTLFRSHDAHENGMHFPVEELDVESAVSRYGDQFDILLMSWPVAEETASRSLLGWDSQKPVVFIGEVTDLAKHELGGCATDSFFAMTDVISQFQKYKSTRSGLDRAQVRQVKPDAAVILDQFRVTTRIMQDGTRERRLNVDLVCCE